MKICMILTNNFDPDVRVEEEARYLVKNGAQVEILRWDRSRDLDDVESKMVDGIKFTLFGCYSVLGTGMKQLPAFFRFIAKVRRYLKEHKFDYYHLHDMDGGIVGMFALPRGAKYVFDMHEFFETESKLKSFAIRRIVMHCIKKSMASLYENDQYLAKPYGRYREKLFALRNYPDERVIERKDKTPSDVFRIGYHGSVRGQIPHFTALFEAVRDMPDVRVDINGGGIDHDELVQMAEAFDNVYVKGMYNGITESTGLYQNTDVLFCGYDKHVPHYKNFEPVKFFEAIITGTPIISQCGIDMGDQVTDKGYGLSVETDNALEVKTAINRFKKDKEFYQDCRQNEIRDAGKYNWQSQVAVLKMLYHL